MRDLVIGLIIFGAVPFILRNPLLGLLFWVWVGIMNPHRLAYGWAYGMPFAQIVALATLVSLLINSKRLATLPKNPNLWLLVAFTLWLGVSPLFSFHPENELEPWLRAFKVQIMVLVAFLIVNSKEDINKLVWVLTLSVGFFGIKGGLFTLATMGSYRVWGPANSFISDNNQLALAIIMAVPLLRYLQMQVTRRWLRWAFLGAIVLCVASALGSHSRGAFLALLAMSGWLWLKGRNKLVTGMLVLLALPLVFAFMPESWTERMSTIQSYDQDASAMGRINSWMMAWNLALSRFPLGGGFAIYEPDVFMRFAPNPASILAAHSIYFQILGEHGFMGLFLFLLVFLLAWRNGAWIIKKTAEQPVLSWARDLAAMIQVSLFGYLVGGAFLSLTYFDLPYYLVAVLIILRAVVTRELAANNVALRAGAVEVTTTVGVAR